MRLFRIILLSGVAVCWLPAVGAEDPARAPLPEIHQLLQDVQAHQRTLDKIRENYTFTSTRTVQDLDSNGQVKKTEVTELDEFFVNSHQIGRVVKKDGKPLDDHEQQKETERVTKLVEKAQKTAPGVGLEGQEISITRILELMDERNPRRETYRGRPAIVFDFVGRKDAQTHGLAEDASKKLEGTIWIDEADRQVAHLDVHFDDNFKIGGGIVATIDKGSNFHFDQSPVESGLWLPTGGEGTAQARVLLLKNMRQHFMERDFDFKRFHVDAQMGKDAQAVAGGKP
jgi:hypothetical protein